MASKWHAIVAVILAVGVAAAIIILSSNELTTSGHVTGEESTLLSTVLGTAVGAIAGYLGTHGRSDGGEPAPASAPPAEGPPPLEE